MYSILCTSVGIVKGHILIKQWLVWISCMHTFFVFLKTTHNWLCMAREFIVFFQYGPVLIEFYTPALEIKVDRK
jgi:hypothetical protein